MTVHILATCLEPERIRSTLLVFQTLRIGFPSSRIFVYGNCLDSRVEKDVRRITGSVGAAFKPIPLHAHGEWIERLLESEREPFWICDTDMAFYDPVEGWTFDLFAGRYEPEFIEPWTKTVHMSRLHPSLMGFNPTPLRAAIREWPKQHEFFNSVDSNLFRWHWVPERDKPLKFYDTCSGLYHALGGTPFTEEQNKAFTHLFCGSYAHLSKDYKPFARLHESHPSQLRGLWERQKEWYEQQTTTRS